MKTKYTLFRRGEMFYMQDSATGKQTSLHTKDETEASLASEQISREAFDDPVVREHAWETSKDLERIGLSNDRLNRDLIRMFKLSAE